MSEQQTQQAQTTTQVQAKTADADRKFLENLLDKVIEKTQKATSARSDAFELGQREAKLWSSSALVPKEFQGNLPNCYIALEMSARTGFSPLSVMQNMYIVYGKPSWSSQFIIAAVNSTGKFTPVRFAVTGEGDDRTCVAWANELETGERLESPPISIGIAKKEGWFDKNGSKWKTMPELMLRYRAATLFGRLYAPEVLMGMKAQEEIEDTEEAKDAEPPPVGRFSLRNGNANGNGSHAASEPDEPKQPEQPEQPESPTIPTEPKPEAKPGQDQSAPANPALTAEIEEEIQRTGVSQTKVQELVQATGVKRYKDLTVGGAEAMIAELRKLADKEEPREPVGAGARRERRI